MRLLNTQTKVLEQYFGAEVPPFVILSHRWSRPTENELTLQDLKAGIFSNPGVSTSHKAQGFSKVNGACNKAVQDGYDWIWIDSCCIDQTSSAELQESINSMWNYYAHANICYAYLSDVPGKNIGHESFQNSEWWSRGWTLQELLAPKTVEFYADDWKFLGTRAEMFQEIAGITGIDQNVLKMVKSIDRCTAAEKLSWAAHRQVLREEDESYSLLGLLKVSLPLLYGEGRERAFLRLQDAIYSAKSDTTLFLYRYSPFKGQLPLLAYSPASFCPRSSCSKCGTNQTECLHPTFAYDKLRYRVTWDNEAYKSLHASEPLPRQNVTATLQLLEYGGIVAQELRDQVLHIPGNRNTTPSHIAVLNCTVDKYPPDSAFCLGLTKGFGDAFHRMLRYPVSLFEPTRHDEEVQETRMLIYSSELNSDEKAEVVAGFAVFKYPPHPPLIEMPTWQTSISTWTDIKSQFITIPSMKCFPVDYERRVPRPWVSFEATLARGSKIIVTLEPYEYVWSIKRIDFVEMGAQTRANLFRTSGGQIDCWRIFLPQEEAQIRVSLREVKGSHKKVPAEIGYKVTLEIT